MAAAALVYMGVDKAGAWKNDYELLTSLCDVFVVQGYPFPAATQLRKLNQTLSSSPIDEAAVEGWFRTTFP